LINAAAARIKTMMTSNQANPMAHIISGIIPSIIMFISLGWFREKTHFLEWFEPGSY
jgi:hypothetical protein